MLDYSLISVSTPSNTMPSNTIPSTAVLYQLEEIIRAIYSQRLGYAIARPSVVCIVPSHVHPPYAELDQPEDLHAHSTSCRKVCA
jgi:hypothetical protein